MEKFLVKSSALRMHGLLAATHVGFVGPNLKPTWSPPNIRPCIKDLVHEVIDNGGKQWLHPFGRFR